MQASLLTKRKAVERLCITCTSYKTVHVILSYPPPCSKTTVYNGKKIDCKIARLCRKFEQSCISDWLSVSAAIYYPLSEYWLQFHTGTSQQQVQHTYHCCRSAARCLSPPGDLSPQNQRFHSRHLLHTHTHIHSSRGDQRISTVLGLAHAGTVCRYTYDPRAPLVFITFGTENWREPGT